MGTPCGISVVRGRAKIQARQAIAAAIADVERLEALYSRYRSNSFLSEINRAAAQAGSIEVDEETACLLDYAVTCYEQSGGLFDISSGILRQAWKYDQTALPSQAQIGDLLERVGLAQGQLGTAAFVVLGGGDGNRFRRHRQGICRGSRRHSLSGARSEERGDQSGRRYPCDRAREPITVRGGWASAIPAIRRDFSTPYPCFEARWQAAGTMKDASWSTASATAMC